MAKKSEQIIIQGIKAHARNHPVKRAAIALGIQAAMMEHLADGEAFPPTVVALEQAARDLCPRPDAWIAAWEHSIRIFGR